MGLLKHYYCQACEDYSNELNTCNHKRELVFSDKQRTKLSKFLSYIFRHDPGRIGIEVDEEGFSRIGIDDLIAILQNKAGLPWLSRRSLDALILLDHKGRFEIRNDKFRARYGHSIKGITLKPTSEDLPAILYHGTNQTAYQQIIREGLKPMGRNLVHLTSSISDATIVGHRHGGELVLLEINVTKAILDGFFIWQAGKTVFVSNFIPKEYLKRIS